MQVGLGEPCFLTNKKLFRKKTKRGAEDKTNKLQNELLSTDCWEEKTGGRGNKMEYLRVRENWLAETLNRTFSNIHILLQIPLAKLKPVKSDSAKKLLPKLHI